MTAFDDELKAKAYALVGDEITLDAFKDWYRGRMAEAAKTVFGAEAIEPEHEPAAPFKAPPVAERFTDYARSRDEPDEETLAHHRRLLGSGSDE